MTELDPSSPLHVPVLADDVTRMLVWRNDGVYVDGTLGDGGHSERIASLLDDNGRLIGIDRDPAAHERAAKRLTSFHNRVVQRQATFADTTQVLDELGIALISGILLDLGVSSLQFDTGERGFSFRHSGPLDMRMGPDAEVSAFDVVNTWSERDLAHTFRLYGEEKRAHVIARNIVRARPISTTDELTQAIGSRGSERPEKTLARVFQAIRIVVNTELDQLERVLNSIIERIEVNGRIVIISYHSLEDRIVKHWMRQEATDCVCPPDAPICVCDHRARLRVITRRAIIPSEQETRDNPRARSAKMRVAERITTLSE